MNIKRERLHIVIAGLIIGVIASLLVFFGNPANMGFCIACFLRDTAGGLGLHRAAAVQYIRPEIIGLVLGSFGIALFKGEFSAKGGSAPLTRFVLGFFVMIGCLMFLGCPFRMILRLAGGDLNALLGGLGFVLGILAGVFFLKKGYSLKRSYSMARLEGFLFPAIQVVVFILLVAAPAFIYFTEAGGGPGAKHAAVLISLAAGLIVGALAQRTRLCMVGGIRDVVLFREPKLLMGFGAILISALVCNLILTGVTDGTYFHLAFEGQPIAHTDGLWNCLGMVLVGYDKSDDASVYYLDENTALVQTTDFFPPIVDDPFLYGQIAAANAISDVYAMGGEPKLALNILCLPESMTREMVQELLRGGYDKAYEAGAIITGGHTIHGAEPIYGLAVSGFVHPRRVLTNSGAKPGDVLLLTKPLGVGVLTTAAKAGLAEPAVMDRIYRQMAALNRTARDIMVKYRVHSCTDVTGFALLGHGFEMAQGSGCTVHIQSGNVPFHPEAWDLAAMGLIPAGAYRNRDYAEKGVTVRGTVSRTMQDLLYDPQTSGGLLMAVDPADAEACLRELRDSIPAAAQVGYVTERQDNWLILE